MNIPIIYEDENIVVVNKPSGLVVHPDGKSSESTLVDWILERYPEIKDVGEPLILSSGKKILRPGIVHRLDKDTSGILLITKNQKTFKHLKKQFQEHTIKKIYKALVYGELKKNKGIINEPIGRSGKDFRKRLSGEGARGEMRKAITEYQVIVKNKKYSFVEMYPKTGRTHQIRVHFKAIGHPVVCDSLYAPKRECPKELGRLALHAFSLEFMTPEKTMLRLEAPLPEDIQNMVNTLFSKLRST